jgi:GT2 family glycosyltransferase
MPPQMQDRRTAQSGRHGVGDLAVSIVMPTRNSTATLKQALQALRASDLPRDSYEIIVVDDASSDASATVAARYADKVVKLTGLPVGGAYARNRGAELASGAVLAFVDSDTIVSPDTLSGLLTALDENPDLVATAAARDESSCAPNFVSQYWNLLLAFGEQRQPGRCGKFASGCGLIRRSVFFSAGMYDEWREFSSGTESLELGERLLRGGHGVRLSGAHKVSHVGRWDFHSVCAEIWHRSRAVARSLGYLRVSSAAPSEVVFTLSRALTPAAALLGTMMLAAAFVPPSRVVAKLAAVIMAILLTNLSLHRYYASTRGVLFAVLSAPLHLVVQLVTGVALCTGWILRDMFGDVSPSAAIQSYAEVGLEIWPPIPRKL